MEINILKDMTRILVLTELLWTGSRDNYYKFGEYEENNKLENKSINKENKFTKKLKHLT